jgi:hypothetical protein
VPKQSVRSIRQDAQQVGATGEGDVDQVSPAAHAERAEIRPTGKDGVVKHHAPVALHAPAIEIPLEDAVLDEQAGVKVCVFKVGHRNVTTDQLDDLVERAPLQVEPVQHGMAHDDGLVDAAQILAAEPTAHDERIKVKQVGDPRVLNRFADAQMLEHLRG